MVGVRIISIADLLNLSCPLSGAASLSPDSASSPPSKRWKLDGPDENPVEPPLFPPDWRPDPGLFSPLGSPVILVGTVDLFPCDSDRSLGCLNHCLSFSDGSSRVCCYVLDFDLNIVGRKVCVLAWNFLPLKHHSDGVLEVIRWSLLELEVAAHCDSSLSIPPACSSREDNSEGHCRASGIVRAVSPIFSSPCVKEKEDNQKNARGTLLDFGDAIGFVAEILTCTCDACSDSSFVAEHGHHLLKDNNCHSFTNSELVYFIKPTSVWCPVLYMLIGKLITVSKLKRKLAFVGSELSCIMFVSTAVTKVSLNRLPLSVVPVASLGKSDKIYNGIVTGIYMQGMVIELDDKTWLLTTDPVHASQHSFRVGAAVSVRNFHLVPVKYSWLKTFLLGTCFRTCISIKSFSTTGTRCHFKSEATSLLEKFIESLTFSAKFWVLLLVSCFKKKFVGMISYKDILGSSRFIHARCHQKQGFVQTYASRYLPKSAFEVKPGLFMNFCNHLQCSSRRELNLTFLRLVIPMSNLSSWCEAKWISMQSQKHNAHEIFEKNQYLDHLFCREISYNPIIRRIIRSDEIGFILMGMLKICPYSGRLQLIDATGSLDVVVPDLPLDIDFQAIYEVKDYKLVMEGSPNQVDHMQYCFDGPLSCKAIFQRFSHKATLDLAVYVHFYLRNSTCTNFSPQLHSSMVKSDSFKCSNGEMFHLLYVTHKFPLHRNQQDDMSLSNSSGFFAEALILPYDLVPRKTHKDGALAEVIDNLDKKSDYIRQLKDTIEQWSAMSKHVQYSTSTQLAGSDNVSREHGKSFQVPCSLEFKNSNFQWSQIPAYLYYGYAVKGKDNLNDDSDSRVLLEFRSDSLSMYQMLRVGLYYILKCSQKDLEWSSKGCGDRIYGKSLVISQSNLWSLSLSFGETEHQNELSGNDSSCVYSVKINEVSSKENCQHEQMFLEFFDQTHGSDVFLHLSTKAIRQINKTESLQQPFNGQPPAPDDIINVSLCIRKMMAEATIPSGIIDHLSNELPQGNQISLRGNIENVFIYDRKPKCCVSSSCATVCNHWSTCKVCVYMNDEYHKVRICGTLSRFTFPVGLGPGANATFHKLLLTRTSSRQNELLLTPMTFIVVNSVKEIGSQCHYRSLIQESRWNIQHDEFLNTISLGLISKMLHGSDSNLIRLHCRVVGVKILVLENQTHESAEVQSGQCFTFPAARITLAGFLVDDGSSLCSCWADYGRAETLLRLCGSTQKTFFRNHKISTVSRNKDSECTVGYYLRKLLKKHQRVIIKGHGAASDLPCEHLSFSFDSQEVFSNAQERLLRFIVLNGCHASTFNVAGSMVDPNPLFYDHMEFLKYDQALQSMPHLWVKEVGPVDPVKEARNILNDLCKE